MTTNTKPTPHALIADNGGGLHLYAFADSEHEHCTWAGESMEHNEGNLRETLAALNRGESPDGWDTNVDDAQAAWDTWTPESLRNGGWCCIEDETGAIDVERMGAAGQRIFAAKAEQ